MQSFPCMSPRLLSTEWDSKYYMQAPPCNFSFETLTCLGRFPTGSGARTSSPRCWIDRIRPWFQICSRQACARSSGKGNIIKVRHWYNLESIELAAHLIQRLSQLCENRCYPTCNKDSCNSLLQHSSRFFFFNQQSSYWLRSLHWVATTFVF